MKDDIKIMDDYWKDFEILNKQSNSKAEDILTKDRYVFFSDNNYPTAVNSAEKKKQIKQERVKKIYEILDENKEKLSEKYTDDALTKYAIINAPIFNKITRLRNNELREIRKMPEYKQFVLSLPDNQSITIDGYLIYRKKVLVTNEGFPGFSNEETFDYIYDNPAEDITILFGSKEYCDEIKSLKEQIISWDEFINKYYII